MVQTQLEMLASGSSRAVLLSYTATHGMHVLQLRRDDAYCAALLRQLASIQVGTATRILQHGLGLAVVGHAC